MRAANTCADTTCRCMQQGCVSQRVEERAPRDAGYSRVQPCSTGTRAICPRISCTKASIGPAPTVRKVFDSPLCMRRPDQRPTLIVRGFCNRWLCVVRTPRKAENVHH